MTGLEVRPVQTRSDMKAFIELPWRLYAGDPNWVPPLRSDMARLLDPKKHPFWDFSERELFLVRRGSEVIGRIAAIVDGNHNRFHNEKMGAWGFFECTQSPEAAVALFAAAEDWIRSRGAEFLRGPLNPSANYEVGLLIDGFDTPPTMMMTYNPAYYTELVRLCGFRKEKDLYAYILDPRNVQPLWSEAAKRLAEKGDFTIRQADRRNLKADIRLMNSLYNECWSHNWGFVPMTDAEIEETAKGLMFILDTDMAFFFYHHQEPVGACLALPDVNPLLKRFNGRLGLSALIKKYLYWSEITRVRCLLLGVKEQYLQMGVPLVAFDYLVRMARQKSQYREVEFSWNLEDNLAANLALEEIGARVFKRYRLYRKDL